MNEERPRIRIPNRKEVQLEIANQSEHQQSVLHTRPHVISRHMTHQETFDAYSSTPEFNQFIYRMTQLSYCPPDQWDLFRSIVRGRLNEMMALDMLSRTASEKGNTVVLDSSHSKQIMKSLFPDLKETDHGEAYGFESSSLRVGKVHIPSPDYMLTTNGKLRAFGETSLKAKPLDWEYWWEKRKKFEGTRRHFMQLGGYFYGLFVSMRCDLTITSEAYQRRKQLGLLRKKTPTTLAQLPYSLDELDEFLGDFIPKIPPHSEILTQSDEHRIHWRELIVNNRVEELVSTPQG